MFAHNRPLRCSYPRHSCIFLNLCKIIVQGNNFVKISNYKDHRAINHLQLYSNSSRQKSDTFVSINQCMNYSN